MIPSEPLVSTLLVYEQEGPVKGADRTLPANIGSVAFQDRPRSAAQLNQSERSGAGMGDGGRIAPRTPYGGAQGRYSAEATSRSSRPAKRSSSLAIVTSHSSIWAARSAPAGLVRISSTTRRM